MKVYYNEIDPYCVKWLQGLMAAGLLPLGDVDSRSIADVQPEELKGYDQCHFFAGLGGWPRALELASWRGPVWTGSCPCQPFSSAGKQKGFADERHLWPEWFRLVQQCGPPVIFGEQVASAKLWLDAVLADLESDFYACGAAVIPAAGVGAPHRRDRLWFVAVADSQSQYALPFDAEMASPPAAMGDPQCAGLEGGTGQELQGGVATAPSADVANANQSGCPQPERVSAAQAQPDLGTTAGLDRGDHAAHPDGQQAQRLAEPWGECDFWGVEPDVGRVAHGVPSRVAKLRALGNAIVPQVAAEFIKAVGLTLI